MVVASPPRGPQASRQFHAASGRPALDFGFLQLSTAGQLRPPPFAQRGRRPLPANRHSPLFTRRFLMEHRYNRLTWPEMNDAIARQPLIMLPTASTEQHGHHLPIDVDVFLAE